MIKVEFNGKTYERTSSGNWIDKNGCKCPHLQKELDKIYVETVLDVDDFSNCDMTVEELMIEADKFKAGGSNGFAIKIYENILDYVSHNQRYGLLPKLSSCYRSSGQPEKSIKLYELAKFKYGNGVISPSFCTSLAAAYADMGDYKNGRHFADMACAKSNGKNDGELMSVYARLNKLMGDTGKVK